MIAGVLRGHERKVRAPKDRMVGNANRSQDQGIVQQKVNRHEMFTFRGKGETVR